MLRVVTMHTSERLVEPEPESGRPTDAGRLATFPVVARGVDPLEVQAFAKLTAAELSRLARENAELRAEVAQQAAVAAVVDPAQLGPEALALLEQVRLTAATIVEQAQRQADAIVAAADRRAEDVRRAARVDADQLAEDARVEGRALVADASADHREVLADLRRQRREVDHAQQEIARYAEQLAGSIDAAVAGAPVHLTTPAASPSR